MAEARRRSARVPGRSLPAVLAAVALTVGCSTRDGAVDVPPFVREHITFPPFPVDHLTGSLRHLAELATGP